jgi:hypothetical protein
MLSKMRGMFQDGACGTFRPPGHKPARDCQKVHRASKQIAGVRDGPLLRSVAYPMPKRPQ